MSLIRSGQAIVVALLLLAAGCGSDGDRGASLPAATTSVAAPTTSEAPPTAPSDDRADPSDLGHARLDDIVDAWAERADIPGVIAQIAGPSGLIWQGASGNTTLTSDGEALTVDHPFRIASITKTVTAATVLRLAETGLIDLDAGISEYLPNDLVDRVHVSDGVSRGEEVTVTHLVANTSGIHDFFTDPSFVPDVLADPNRVWSHVELIDYAVTHGEPHFAPGDGYHYSDTGYRLLGLVVEEAAGQPLHDAYRELIFDPLGMDDTFLEGFEEPRGETLSHPYIEDLDGMTIHHSVDWAGGGLVSTASDLTAFLTALVQGQLFEHPETLQAMTDLRTTEVASNYEKSYGLGWLGLRSGDSELAGHDGYWGSFMYVVPDLDVTITGTVNQADALQLDLIVELLSALAEIDDGST